MKKLKSLWAGGPKRRMSPLAAVGSVFTAVALVITALILAGGLHDVLTGPDWLTWTAAVGAALALDAVWTSGLAQLSTALKVRGGLLWLSGAMVAVGLGGSVAAVLVFGHTLLLAAPAIVGMVLLVADRASGYLTPSADVVGRIDRQRRDELDRAALARAAKTLSESEGGRKADERAVSRRKQLSEAVDAQRYAVEFQAALMAAKAELYGDLSAAVDAHQDDAAKLDALLGSGTPGELSGVTAPTAPAVAEVTAPAIAPAAPRIGATSEEAVTAPTVPNLRPNRPVLTDDELLKVGRGIWKNLPEPVSQAAFIKAYRDAGHRGSYTRLAALYKALKAELAADEIEQDEHDAA